MKFPQLLISLGTISLLFTAALWADDLAESGSEAYTLRYQFAPGDVIDYRVEHRATVDTKIEGNRDVAKSRSVSTKRWVVDKVEDEAITFSFTIEDVDMWQKSEGRDEVRYNSLTHTGDIPAQYQHVASTLGQPLAVVTVSDTGSVIKREQGKEKPDLGFGGIIFPLPSDAITVGHTWTESKTLRLNERDGRVKQVKVQVKYRLEDVKKDVATISIRTEVITPLTKAALKSQLVQQLSNGEAKFDLKKGRLLSKKLEWDETVIGFNGPASNMKYLAKFTEEILSPAKTAKRHSDSRK